MVSFTYKTALWLFISTFVLIANSTDEQAELNEKGVAALKAHDYLSAIRYLENAVNLPDKNETVFRNLIYAYVEYGMDQINRGQLSTASAYPDKAMQLHPADTVSKSAVARFFFTRGSEYYKTKKYTDAEKDLQKALSLKPNSVSVLVLLGEIAYINQRLSVAEKYWTDANRYSQGSGETARLLLKLKKQSSTEQNFRQVQGDVFEIHYNQAVVHEEVFDIRQHLMDCYREIGQDLSCFPEHTIIVLLYEEKEFRGLLNVREQIAGLYDGKIRIPVNYKKYPLSYLKQILRHEYTHALLYDIAGSHCPVWLHEGLAVFEEKADRSSELSLVKKAIRTGNALTFTQLGSQSAWNRSDIAPQSYSQAYAIVNYIIDRWGLYLLNKCITQMKQGYSFETIFQRETNRTLDELDREWKKAYMQ